MIEPIVPSYSLAQAPRKLKWTAKHPALCSTLLLMVLYTSYVYSEKPLPFVYDSDIYWRLATQFWPGSHFDFMLFNSVLRGYLFPLLLSPLVKISSYYGLAPMDVYRVVGASIAAVLFGTVLPGLWRATLPHVSSVSVSRRLLFGMLGFVFWRGYFQYPLSDFPAILALASSLWLLLSRSSVHSGLLAGVLIAAAVNFRPVYAAALPLVAVLLLWAPPTKIKETPITLAAWLRGLAFAAGLIAMLLPQRLINRTHFGSNSFLVITNLPSEPSLYLQQLEWGLQYKKYETNIGSSYPSAQMFFIDRRGSALWQSTGLPKLESYVQYWHIFQSAPLNVIRTWAEHLFNGLDLQYATPYILDVYQRTWLIALLNYTVIFGGLWVLLKGAKKLKLTRSTLRLLLVLLALIGPCAAVLPVAIECRFLLPVHLLLSAAFSFMISPLQMWRASSIRRQVWGFLLYLLFIGGCFSLSINTQKRLQLGPREVFAWQDAVDFESILEQLVPSEPQPW